jgi:MFS family permease
MAGEAFSRPAIAAPGGRHATPSPDAAPLGSGRCMNGRRRHAGSTIRPSSLSRAPRPLRISDRTGRHWALSIGGYALTVVSVPLLAVSGPLWSAATLTVAERFGKAVRTPARDTMLAQAGLSIGRGWAFAVHEALDQTGALASPLLVALLLALTGSYRDGFAVLALSSVVTLIRLARLRARVPAPAEFDPGARPRRSKRAASRSGWRGFPAGSGTCRKQLLTRCSARDGGLLALRRRPSGVGVKPP